MISLLFRIWQSLMGLSFKCGVRLTGIEAQLQLLREGQRVILCQLALIVDTLIPGPAERLVFTAHLDDGTIQNEVTHMEMRDDQQVLLTIQPVDAKGKPAVVDGAPVWAASDETVITVQDSADGLSAMVLGVAPGSARVVVTADADLGSGITPLTGTLDFTITGGSAVALTITAGIPAPQSAGTP